jgi:hypothetical protein
VSQSTLDYLKERYLQLENEIATASHHDHELIVADLQYRKLVIADEIERVRRNEDVSFRLRSTPDNPRPS